MNILTIQQAANRLNISKSMVCRLMRQEKLNGVKFNFHCWQIDDDDKFRDFEYKHTFKKERLNYDAKH